jgi:hypothetical protein
VPVQQRLVQALLLQGLRRRAWLPVLPLRQVPEQRPQAR